MKISKGWQSSLFWLLLTIGFIKLIYNVTWVGLFLVAFFYGSAIYLMFSLVQVFYGLRFYLST